MGERSKALFTRANQVIPGGVNSPARAFGSVGGNPLFITHGEGCRIFDVDGNTYIDHVCSWGPLIHGHAYPPIVEALTEVASRGTSFGAPTEVEVRLADAAGALIPGGVEAPLAIEQAVEDSMLLVNLGAHYHHSHSDCGSRGLAQAGWSPHCRPS